MCSYARSGRMVSQRFSSCRRALKQQSKYILFAAARIVLRRSSFSSAASTAMSLIYLVQPNTNGRQFSISSQK